MEDEFICLDGYKNMTDNTTVFNETQQDFIVGTLGHALSDDNMTANFSVQVTRPFYTNDSNDLNLTVNTTQ